MHVRHVMTRNVLSISADDSIESARTRMAEAGVHQLVVRGTRGGVLGVIGREDLSEAPRNARIADFMYRRLVSVRPDTPIGDAAALMRTHAVRSLPVMSGARLVGIVTVSDMLDLIDSPAPDTTAPEAGKSVR